MGDPLSVGFFDGVDHRNLVFMFGGRDRLDTIAGQQRAVTPPVQPGRAAVYFEQQFGLRVGQPSLVRRAFAQALLQCLHDVHIRLHAASGGLAAQAGFNSGLRLIVSVRHLDSPRITTPAQPASATRPA